MTTQFTLTQQSSYTPAALLHGLELLFAEHHADLGREALRHHPAHQKKLRQQEQVSNEITNRLGKKYSGLVDKLEDLNNSIVADEQDFTYLQGYLDCVALLRMLKII
jgi:hypothetical protein